MSHFRFITAGESHGPALMVTVSGVPAGLRLDRDRMNRELARRQQGYGRGGRMKIESDEVEMISGVRGAETLGSPIGILIRNRDFENWRASMDPWTVDETDAKKRRLRAPRPGHADLAGGQKYDRQDLRDILERASARETAARVAAGAIAKQLLAVFDVEVRSSVVAIGSAGDASASPEWDHMGVIPEDSQFRTTSKEDETAMRHAIDEAKSQGETLGGVIVVVAAGLPVGLGSYVQWDERLDGRIGQAILSIPAVKAVSLGEGIAASALPGSEVHDPISFAPDAGFTRTSNRAGGLEGGVTNGEEIRLRIFMKPISTLRRGLPSVDLDSREPQRSQWERSDVTAVPACSVICEAMLAIVLANAMREKFGGDSLNEMQRNFTSYRQQVEEF